MNTVFFNSNLTLKGHILVCDVCDVCVCMCVRANEACDNCVELDLASVIGIAAGNVVATIVIAVGVYLTTAQTRFGSSTSHKKGKVCMSIISLTFSISLIFLRLH